MKNKSKNKFLLFSVVSILTMFLGIVSADAKTINKDDVPNSSYIIGKYMFTRNINDDYNGRLTTKLIMLASKTIEGNSIDDMIIYYKTASGKWIDGLDGQVISNIDTFEIKYIGMQIVLEVPTLTEDGVGGDTEEIGIDYKVSNIDFSDGIEVYKSTDGENYTLEKVLTKSELSGRENKINTVAYIGEHNYYKVRAYKEVNGKKVYSEYSEIVEVTGPTLSAPTLTEDGVGGDTEEIGIDYKVSNIDFSDGIEVYKSTDGENYTLEKVLTKSELLGRENKINTLAYIGEHNYYKVRAYKEVNGKKVYSEYSEVVEIIGPKEQI